LLDIHIDSVKSFDDVAKHFKLIEDEHKYSEADGANIPEMNSPTHRTSINDSDHGDKCSFQAMVSNMSWPSGLWWSANSTTKLYLLQGKKALSS
jgi:hypothetical protein